MSKKPSEFMDKQIMELSRSYSDDFSQLSYPPQTNYDDDDEKDVDLLSSFQLPSVRHGVSHQSSTLENRGGSREQSELTKSRESALISVIDWNMNHHFDNLQHAVEGLSSRVSQLETRLRLMENSVDSLKDSTQVNHGRTDGKLRELENILREVEGGMKDLSDKQEISEVQLQLEKFQMLKANQTSEQQRSDVEKSSGKGVSSSSPQQSHQPYSTPGACLQPPSLPPNVPPTPYYQNFSSVPSADQLPSQQYQNQIPYNQQSDSNYSAPVLNPPPTPQAYYMSQLQQSQDSQPSPTAPYQLFPPVPQLSQTSHMQQQQQQQQQSSLIHNPAETPYVLSQSYPPSIHKTSNMPSLVLPTEQQYSSMQYTHDRPTSNYSTDFSPPNMQPVQHSRFDNLYSHGRSPSDYSDSQHSHMSPLSPSSFVHSGGSSVSRLPTAKILPYALPMAASVDKESGSSGTGNRIPVDNVIDKVVAMGFRRDIVTATVKKMTENGQAVDLNVVLDKLMNSGESQHNSG